MSMLIRFLTLGIFGFGVVMALSMRLMLRKP
jgi:hypothetical protein